MWPAIWTLGVNGNWPKKGEIDIMEWWARDAKKSFSTMHYSIGGKHKSDQGKIVSETLSKEFHIYAMEWFPDRIDVFFDKEKFFSFPIEKATEGDFNPYRKPHFLLLNLALGGQTGGKIDDAKLPQQFIIDYVRIYQQKAK